MEFFKSIVYFVLSLQEKVLTARLNKTLGVKNKSKRKKFYLQGDLLSLDSLADTEKNKIEEELALILKKYNYEPEALLEYVKTQGTGVFYIQNPVSLNSVGENEGFIYPQKGGKALYISSLVKQGFKLTTPEMFILTHGEINKFYFIYHFYNWFTFKRGISGMDSDSINLLNKYLFNATEEEINKLQLSDIYKLKDAIKQDKSAIEFVFKLCQNIEGAKNAMKKLQDGGASL